MGDSNVGLSGKLLLDPQWDYYELSSGSKVCDGELRCDNGKCLRSIGDRCDGKNDCGDNSDEGKTCQASPDLRLRLVGGRADYEGRIEVRFCKETLHVGISFNSKNIAKSSIFTEF